MGGIGLLSQNRGGATSYFLQDGQGSTRALTNDTGAITDTYSYSAFGELFNQTGSTTNNYLYTGQQFDSLTSLYDLRARYYNPALGRFLSQDTYPFDLGNPVELNRYVYTANNPVNGMDPSGHNFVEYSIANENSDEEGASLEPVGKKFASEADEAVTKLFNEFDDDFWNALSQNAGDLGEETTNLLNIKGSPASGTWSDYIAAEDYDDIVAAFKFDPQAYTLNQDMTVYRYWSGDPAREVGKWLTTYPNLTLDEARALLSLPNSNLAVNITQFTIPRGTTILVGQAASQTSASWAGSYAIGGGFQIYLSDPLVLIKIMLSVL